MNQAERFRAELRGRRRQPGESLQKLYHDICRLMALAYPGPTSSLTEVVARDAFLDALGSDKLRLRILEKEPSNLADALKIVSRLEAFDKSGAIVSVQSCDNGRQEKPKYGMVWYTSIYIARLSQMSLMRCEGC